MGTITRRADVDREAAQLIIPKPRKLQQYWVLVLEPKDLSGHLFVRVGVGKVYPQECWDEGSVQVVTIV